MYYRMLSAQVHQIKEEIIFFEKNIDNPNAKTQVNLVKLTHLICFKFYWFYSKI